VPPAAADSVDDFTAAVPGIPGKTWMDLLRQVFPDIALGPKNEAIVRGNIALRPIEKDGVFTDDCPDELKLSSLEVSQARIADKPRLIVGIATDGDSCVAPLVLFEGSGEGKLLDAVNVKQDKNYSFGRDFTRSLGPNGQLAVVTSFHINAGEGYDIEALILATADKLSSIDPIFAKSETDCRRSVPGKRPSASRRITARLPASPVMSKQPRLAARAGLPNAARQRDDRDRAHRLALERRAARLPRVSMKIVSLETGIVLLPNDELLAGFSENPNAKNPIVGYGCAPTTASKGSPISAACRPAPCGMRSTIGRADGRRGSAARRGDRREIAGRCWLVGPAGS
jgi:hypothetical protein